jgi:hypothetical protein
MEYFMSEDKKMGLQAEAPRLPGWSLNARSSKLLSGSRGEQRNPASVAQVERDRVAAEAAKSPFHEVRRIFKGIAMFTPILYLTADQLAELFYKTRH